MHRRNGLPGISPTTAGHSVGASQTSRPQAGALASQQDQTFRPRCVSLDLEVGTEDGRIHALGAWLEETELLTREENLVQVFPSSLRVNSIEEARKRLARASITDTYRRQLLRIAGALIEADADEGITTDELIGISGLGSEGVRGALYDLERLGTACPLPRVCPAP